MAQLPLVPWQQIATKDDVDTAVDRLRAEMHVGFADLRTGFIEATNREIKWLVTFAAATSLLVTLVSFIP